MRSTLLTGLTGVVAVMVLAYVGLTAMNLQPHITFGDPVQTASVDRREAEAPAKPAPEASVSKPLATSVPDRPVTAVASVADKAATDLPKAEASAPATIPPPAPRNETVEIDTAPATTASLTPPAAAAPAKPPEARTQTEATPQSIPAPPQALAQTKQQPVATPAMPVDQPVLVPRAAEPVPSAVPTPLARPESPEEVAQEDSKKAVPEDNDAAAHAPATAQPDVASQPPKEGEVATKPVEPVPASGADSQPSAGLKPVDLSRPMAERAGVLTIGNRVVQLAGIQPTDPNRSCTGPNGKEWPCGTLARTALRAFLLGRTVTCDVPDTQWTGPVTAACRFERVDLSEWLTRNGWAEPTAGSPLTTTADEARKNSLGIYGNDPRKASVSTLAPEPPKEDPLNPI